MRFIQRDGKAGAVTFVGDEARLLKNGEVVVGWTSGGVLADIPQGDGYVLEVRNGAAVTREDVAIGVLVITMGQSNLSRWFQGPTAVPAASGTWQLVGSDWGTVKGSGARTFTGELAQALGAPVAIINAAVGFTALVPEAATPNGYWLDRSPGSLYADALEMLAKAGGTPELVLWSQGEREAALGVSGARYGAAFTELLGHIASDMADPLVLVSELGATAGVPARRAAIRDAQAAAIVSLANVERGSSTTDLEQIDGIHLTGPSYALNSDRMAISAASFLDGIDVRRAWKEGTDGAEMILGTMVRDELCGAAGPDVLRGGTGDDVLTGGDGDDALDGGPGSDHLRGGPGSDGLVGGDAADVLSGGDGDDRIAGNADDDELCGDAGDDVLTGGTGDDVLFGAAGDDTACFAGAAAGYRWTIATSGEVTVTDIDLRNGDAGTDITVGVELLAFADRLVRLSGDVPPLFGPDADVVDLNGVSSADYAPGTQYDAGGGNDVVLLPANAAAARAGGFDPTRALNGGPGDDVLTGGALADTLLGGAGADMLAGGNGPDRIEGGDGGDRLIGGRGDDVLTGGAGSDRLTGGDGRDRFELTSPTDSPVAAHDVVTDFETGLDLVDFGALAAGDRPLRFIGTAAFSATPGELRLVPYAIGWMVHADIDGNGRAELVLNLVTTIMPDVGSFVL